MNNSYFESNLNIIEAQYPHLVPYIKSLSSKSEARGFYVEASRKGCPTLTVKREGKQKYLYSKYDPLNEAMRWVQGFNPIEEKVVIFIGWGLGYHILEWIKANKGDYQVIVIEPEPEMFYHSLRCIDLNDFIKQASLDIILGDDFHLFYQIALRHMESILSGGFQIVPLPFADIYPQTFYQQLKAELQKILSTRETMLNHMAEMGYGCQANVIANLPAVFRSGFLRHGKNQLLNQPAIIVAAGPSLDRNIQVLNRAYGSAWLFAVDSSLRILQKHGIQTQFVVSKDPTERNLVHFQNLDYADPPILAFDPQVHPSIPGCFMDRLLYIPNRNPAIHGYLRDMALSDDDCLPLSTNVAIAAFNLACHMGCNPIVFVGLDLCFSDGEGLSHASDSALVSQTSFSQASKHLTYSRGEASDTVEVIEVEGVDGKLFPTLQTFYEALKLLESHIQKSNRRCIDASEGGAKIRGTEIKPLNEVLLEFQSNRIDYELVAHFDFPKRNVEHFNQSLDEIVLHLGRCMENADQGLTCLEKSDSPDISLLEQRRKAIEQNYTIYHLLQSALERLMVEIQKPSFWDHKKHSEGELMQRYGWYFGEVKQACQRFIPLYQEAKIKNKES